MTTPKQNSQFTITKKIAKHGAQAVIVIPSILKEKINAGMLVKVTIDILENNVVEVAE
jgi:antitoxin component of MazEF toxin-antitoxin module